MYKIILLFGCFLFILHKIKRDDNSAGIITYKEGKFIIWYHNCEGTYGKYKFLIFEVKSFLFYLRVDGPLHSSIPHVHIYIVCKLLLQNYVYTIFLCFCMRRNKFVRN